MAEEDGTAPTASTSKVLIENGLVKAGDSVMIKLPSQTVRTFRIDSNKPAKIGLGKYGSFLSTELIGKPYGDSFEILQDGSLRSVHRTLNEIQETEATNENIPSTGAQKLSPDQLLALKQQGISGRDMIAKQIEEHAAFELKTEYSKEKYLKRKEAKYLPMFALVEPTAHNVCEYHLEKSGEGIRDLRPDTLAQMLNMANVRPGARLLVVENCHGLVVAAALDRMAGQGRLVLLKDIEGPPDIHIVDLFNFAPAQLEPLVAVAWHVAEQDFVPPVIEPEDDEMKMLVNMPEGATRTAKQNRKLAKFNKRKGVLDKLLQERDEYLEGEFDGCIITCDYDPYSVLEKVLPRLAGSASIVVHSPHYQVLQDLHVKLRQDKNYLAPSITEPWLRKYQVLPGRTHPEMNGLPHGGFLLSATRVFDDENAVSAVAHLRKGKKRKRDEPETAAVQVEHSVQ